MKLLRIATLTFDCPLKASDIALQFGNVNVVCTRTTLRGKPSDRRIAIAEMELASGVLIDADGYILVGVALLAEALATKHSVARYRELIRFLEHAFARPLNQLEKKLSQFLVSSDLGYTRPEVQDYLLHSLTANT